MILFEDESSNGDSEIFSRHNWGEGAEGEVITNGRYYVYIGGTWDTATATVHTSIDGGTTWSAAQTIATFTANGGVWVDLPRKEGQIKVTLSSVGGSTSLTAYIFSK